jgi:hypothetical protein
MGHSHKLQLFIRTVLIYRDMRIALSELSPYFTTRVHQLTYPSLRLSPVHEESDVGLLLSVSLFLIVTNACTFLRLNLWLPL